MKKMMMFAIVCALALGLGAVDARAVTLGIGTNTTNTPGAVFLGYIQPGIPPSDARQLNQLNELLTLALGDVKPFDGQTITRSLFSCPDCPDEAEAGIRTDDHSATNNTVNLTGYDFVVGKYGGGAPGGSALAWWVGGLTGNHQIGGTYDGKDLSNVTRYTGTTSVPEGGMTLMLLGGALLGLEALRRRIRA